LSYTSYRATAFFARLKIYTDLKQESTVYTVKDP